MQESAQCRMRAGVRECDKPSKHRNLWNALSKPDRPRAGRGSRPTATGSCCAALEPFLLLSAELHKAVLDDRRRDKAEMIVTYIHRPDDPVGVSLGGKEVD